jgi:uncharacterized protein (TIGR02996 family)
MSETNKPSNLCFLPSEQGRERPTRPAEKPRVLYIARLHDGTFRSVMAVSHRDARRYFGKAAASIHKCMVTAAESQTCTSGEDGEQEAMRLAYHRGQGHPVEGSWKPLEGFLANVHDHPDDDLLRLVLADFLDEQGATPVQYGSIPEWLRLTWLRVAPASLFVSYHRRGVPYRTTRAVVETIHAWLGRSRLRDSPGLHWGCSRIGGHLCFINEMYYLGDYDHARDLEVPTGFRPLAKLLGCVDAFSRRTWVLRKRPAVQCVRMILFPPEASPTRKGPDHEER